MRIWLDLPDDVVAQLAEQGRDLSRSALEALAIDAYRMQRLTSHQLCQLLEIPYSRRARSIPEAPRRAAGYTFQDFERESTTSARLWQKRQHDLGTDDNP